MCSGTASSFRDETEIVDVTTAFQDTRTILLGAIALETESAPEKDHQEETGGITVEKGLAETIEMTLVIVRDPVEATRLSQDVVQLVTIAESERCLAK